MDYSNKHFERIIKLKFGEIKPSKMEDGMDEQGNCWEGYEQIGMKEKDGRMVPNCVPIKEEQSKVKEGFPIPSPEGEDEDTFIARCNSELYDEYPDDAQRNAICYAAWEKK